MKKQIVALLAAVGFTAASFGQGAIYFDGSNNNNPSSSATSSGQVFLSGVHDTATDINAALLWSATINGTYSPVVTLLLSQGSSTTTTSLGSTQPASGDITFWGGGAPFDNSGNDYAFSSIPVGTTVYFEVAGWTGNYSSYAAALASGQNGVLAGITGAFGVALASPTGQANDISAMPALNLTQVPVPEPGTMALAALGGISMLLFRRRK